MRSIGDGTSGPATGVSRADISVRVIAFKSTRAFTWAWGSERSLLCVHQSSSVLLVPLRTIPISTETDNQYSRALGDHSATSERPDRPRWLHSWTTTRQRSNVPIAQDGWIHGAHTTITIVVCCSSTVVIVYFSAVRMG